MKNRPDNRLVSVAGDHGAVAFPDFDVVAGAMLGEEFASFGEALGVVMHFKGFECG